MTGAVVGRHTHALQAGALLVACAAGALAVVDPPLALVATLGLLFAAIAFTNLTAGVAAFAFLSFFEQIPGGGAVPSLGRIAGVVLLVAALRKPGAPLLVREHPVVGYLGLLFVGWAAASVLWASEPGIAAIGAVQLAYGVALVFIVFAAVRETRDAYWVVWGYVAGGVASAATGLIAPAPTTEAAIDAGRLGGAIGDPNELAAFLVPAVAITAFAIAEREIAHRWVILVALTGSVLAVFLTASRGGYLALGAVLVLAMLAGGRVRPTAFVLSALIGAAGLLYLGLAASVETRERLTGFTSGGGTGRTDIWSVAVEAARDHPVAGVGTGNFPSVEPVYSAATTYNLENVALVVDRPHVVHNTFLEMIVELGLVGGIAFAALLVALLLPAMRSWRTLRSVGDTRTELLARALVIGVVGMLVAFLFISGQTKEQLWLLLGLAFALGSVSARTRVSGSAPR